MHLIPFILQASFWADPGVTAPFLDIKDNFMMFNWAAGLAHAHLFSALYSVGVIVICFCRFGKTEEFHISHVILMQGWGEYYSGTRLAQNDKHEYTENNVLEYYSSTDFPVLVLVCSVLAPALSLCLNLASPPKASGSDHIAIFLVAIMKRYSSDNFWHYQWFSVSKYCLLLLKN